MSLLQQKSTQNQRDIKQFYDSSWTKADDTSSQRQEDEQTHRTGHRKVEKKQQKRLEMKNEERPASRSKAQKAAHAHVSMERRHVTGKHGSHRALHGATIQQSARFFPQLKMSQRRGTGVRSDSEG